MHRIGELPSGAVGQAVRIQVIFRDVDPDGKLVHLVPSFGVRPYRWTDSGGAFDRGAGVAVLELDGAEIAQGGM